MRTSQKIGSWFIIVGLGVCMAANAAATTPVTYSADTSVSLGGATVTIKSGSTATTVTVNDTTLTVAIPINSTFTVTSATRDVTAAGQSTQATYTHTCSGGTVTAVISSTASSTEDVTFRPSGNQCSDTVSSGGGGGVGGGGGGGGYFAPTTVAVSPTAASGNPATPSLAISALLGHPNGTVVLDGKTVFLIKNGQRFGFRDPVEYTSHGYTFSQLVKASAGDFALPFSESNIVKAMTGTLVLDKSDGRTVYMIGVSNTKRGFASTSVFKTLGYSFAKLPKINLSDYPAGDPIVLSSEAHPEGSTITDGKLTWWIKNGTRQQFTTATFNSHGFSRSRNLKANAADMALPLGDPVKFRDGTIIKEDSSYYLISDGKALTFASVSALTGFGYKTSNALSASVSGYEIGAVIP